LGLKFEVDAEKLSMQLSKPRPRPQKFDIEAPRGQGLFSRTTSLLQTRLTWVKTA